MPGLGYGENAPGQQAKPFGKKTRTKQRRGYRTLSPTPIHWHNCFIPSPDLFTLLAYRVSRWLALFFTNHCEQQPLSLGEVLPCGLEETYQRGYIEACRTTLQARGGREISSFTSFS